MTRLFCLALLAACTTPEATDPVDTTDPQPIAFDTPESALWHADQNRWLISNIAGDSSEADGVGWIATLDADGTPNEPRWLHGLNAPKGMAISGGRLYVADIDELLEIDLSNGTILQHIPVPGALFLNDVTASANTVWVSDTFAGAVYSYTPSDGTVAAFAQDPALATVNGLVFDGTRVLACTTGDFTDPSDLGDLISISLAGDVSVIEAGVGKIDGIVQTGNTFLATDFQGILLSIEQDGTTTMLKDLTLDPGMASAADLGYDPAGRIAIPDLFGSTVVILDLDSI